MYLLGILTVSLIDYHLNYFLGSNYIGIFIACLLFIFLLLYPYISARTSNILYVFTILLFIAIFIVLLDGSIGRGIVILGIFPLINAFYNWLSWGVSRYFLDKVKYKKFNFNGVFGILLELFIDFIAAMIILVCLAATLTFSIEIFNHIIIRSNSAYVNWIGRYNAFMHDPLGDGILITGMLITTIIPTFLHMVIGLSAIFFMWTPEVRWLADSIPFNKKLATQEDLSVEFKDKIVRNVRYVRLWYVPASVIVAIIMGGIISFFGILTNKPLFHLIDNAAYCGANFVDSKYTQKCTWF